MYGNMCGGYNGYLSVCWRVCVCERGGEAYVYVSTCMFVDVCGVCEYLRMWVCDEGEGVKD